MAQKPIQAAGGIVVRGLVRALLDEPTQTEPYLRFSYSERPDVVPSTPELAELVTEVHAAIDAVLEGREAPQDIRNFVRSLEDPGQLADNTGYSPDYTFEERQDLLETFDVAARLRKVSDFYQKQYALLEVQARIRQEVEDSASKHQREFYLRQQLRAIQKELGEDDAAASELDELRDKLATANLPEVVRKEADRELARLERMGHDAIDLDLLHSPADDVGGARRDQRVKTAAEDASWLDLLHR